MRWAFLLGAALAAACGSDPVAPTPPPPPPACQVNNTADLTVHNTSAHNYTFDIEIDGVRRGTIAPQQFGGPYTLSAGVTHGLQFIVSNTAIVGCLAVPNFAQCSTQTLACNY